MADELSGQTGAERAMSLMRATQTHANEFWRLGPGGPESRSHLDEALRAIAESYGLFGPRDSMRGQAGVMFGVLLAWKNALGAGTESERNRAVELIEESFGFPGVPVVQSAIGRLMLGQLYAERAMRALQDQTALLSAMTAGGTPRAVLEDLDRAADCFRIVLKASMNAEMTNVATMMLKMTELFRGLLGGIGPQSGGLDLGRMVSVLGEFQRLQTQGFGVSMNGPDLINATKGLLHVDPLDREVPVMSGPESDETFEAPERPALSVDVPALRRELRALLDPADDGDAYVALVSLLRTGETPSWIDEFVSLATRVVDGAEPALGIDHLLLSAALLLRSRRDGDLGWEDDEEEFGSDLEASTASLLTAASTVPADQSTVVELLFRLAVLLPEGTFGRVTDSRADLASAARLLDLRRRETRSIAEKVVFVANPRGDRESATVDALVLRRSFYPRSVGLGRLVDNADGAGTADEVRAALDASLLHLGCGLSSAGTLELAESTELDPVTIGGVQGGLVILPTGAFLPLADRLIEAGFTGVIGWRRPVPEWTAALMLFVLHAELVETGHGPAAAVRAVRRWARHPDIDRLPLLLAGYASRPELLREEDWSALIYRGR